jgi:membrane protein implicated in regulation of membrane protease activity
VKFLERKPKFQSNLDSLINKEAILLTAITETSKGTLRINDVTWYVKTIDDIELEEGTVVKIQAIKGNTLIVEKKGEDLIKV